MVELQWLARRSRNGAPDLPLRGASGTWRIGDVGGGHATGRARPRIKTSLLVADPSSHNTAVAVVYGARPPALHRRIALGSLTMAPIESAAASRTNLFAYAPFGAHIAVVLGLTANVLYVARRAAKSLPPTTTTRAQQPLRRGYAIFFSLLAALSLASVATFAIHWRAISYVSWAESRHSPSGARTGWNDEGRWYFGDWILDIDLRKEADKVAIATPEGFVYTVQHFIGLLTSAVFFGVEGENGVTITGRLLIRDYRPQTQPSGHHHRFVCRTGCSGQLRLRIELILRHDSLHAIDGSRR
jgi:hypothetical protein